MSHNGSEKKGLTRRDALRRMSLAAAGAAVVATAGSGGCSRPCRYYYSYSDYYSYSSYYGYGYYSYYGYYSQYCP